MIIGFEKFILLIPYFTRTKKNNSLRHKPRLPIDNYPTKKIKFGLLKHLFVKSFLQK